MKDDDTKKLREMLRAAFETFMCGSGVPSIDRYCQRCEELRRSDQFSTRMPVCDICFETMPKQELIELSKGIR